MMDVSEALGLWLGPLSPVPGVVKPEREGLPLCTLYLGAGFTKSTNSAAPQFWEYLSPVLETLANEPSLPETHREAFREAQSAKDNKPYESNITELAECLHNYAGRRAVAECFLSEPANQPTALGGNGAYNDWGNPLPPRAEATYRSLDAWKEVVDRHYPLHLSALDPSGPPVLVGRMLSEGWLQQLLSTNWDSYLELGAWLTGLEIDRAGEEPPEETSRGVLQVFDKGGTVCLYTRSDRPVLLKLHSGIDEVSETLKQASQGALSDEQVEKRLRSSFLVSSTDLTHWRDATQWVQDAVSDILRSSRVMLIGVSGGDPVTFRAVRGRIVEWEQANREQAALTQHVETRRRRPEPGKLPLVALSYKPPTKDLRLAIMMTVQQSRGAPAIHAVVGDGRFLCRAAYAWRLLLGMFRSLDRLEASPAAQELALEQQLRVELEQRLRTELNTAQSEGPLLCLLSDALGPNARWAALADGRPPFEAIPTHPASRWWYAPWFKDAAGSPPVFRPAILQLLACAAVLSRSRPTADGAEVVGIKVDPWTGVVAVPDWKLTNERLKNFIAHDLLLLSWPWEPRVGVVAEALRWGLKTSLHWQVGRSLSWLASPRLCILPVGAPDDEALSAGLAVPPEDDISSALHGQLPLAGGFAPLLKPVDWLSLYRSELEGTYP